MHLVVDRPTDENATVISGSIWEVIVFFQPLQNTTLWI